MNSEAKIQVTRCVQCSVDGDVGEVVSIDSIIINFINHIVMKFVRIFLLLLIACTALYSGWFVYGLVFELLDFQIGTYRMLLQTGEQL